MSYMCECDNDDCKRLIPEEAIARRSELNVGNVNYDPYYAFHPDCKGDDGKAFVEKGDGFVIVKVESEE